MQSERNVLTKYLETRDEEAFRKLFQRHAPAVHSVCTRILDDVNEAEDATQAVFVILMKKAAALRERSVGGWLYTTAVLVAREMRRNREIRLRHERSAAAMKEVNSHRQP